jgi:hypothetical protein
MREVFVRNSRTFSFGGIYPVEACEDDIMGYVNEVCGHGISREKEDRFIEVSEYWD